MSKIQQELSEVTGVTKKRGQDEQDFLKALIKATSDLADKDWNKLSSKAQDWFNEAADLLNAKKDLPAFPDAEKEEKKEDPPARTRRGAAKEEPAEPKVDDEVTIVTKRGKTITGKVIEIDKDIVVVDDGKEELELARDRIETIAVAAAEAPAETTSRRRKAADDEPEVPAVAEPAVGDVITAVTARGKELKGEVIEVEDDLVVIKSGDEELELTPSKLTSLVILPKPKTESGGTGRRKAADDGDAGEPAARTRSGKKEEPKEGEKPKRTSAKDNGGVSATQRMRELILDDMDAKSEDIGKKLGKEGIQFRPNTLDLVFADVHKLIKLMREKKLLK